MKQVEHRQQDGRSRAGHGDAETGRAPSLKLDCSTWRVVGQSALCGETLHQKDLKKFKKINLTQSCH